MSQLLFSDRNSSFGLSEILKLNAICNSRCVYSATVPFASVCISITTTNHINVVDFHAKCCYLSDFNKRRNVPLILIKISIKILRKSVWWESHCFMQMDGRRSDYAKGRFLRCFAWTPHKMSKKPGSGWLLVRSTSKPNSSEMQTHKVTTTSTCAVLRYDD
jgi:hypothetical protein